MFDIELSSGQYPDNLFFAAALSYKFEVVATREFPYRNFRFRIWDMYDNYSP